MIVLYILLFIVVLGVVICFHEFGHFYFARKAGILCHEYSFGMGKKIYSKKKGETVYSIRMFPIGGFVSMSGEEVEQVIVKPEDQVRLKFNEEGIVEKIILDIDNPIFSEDTLVIVEKVDLWGKDMAPLYINDYAVKRDALYVFKKEQEIQVAPEERNFISKTLWQRFITIFAGPLANLVLAFVVFMIMSFAMGVANVNSSKIGSVDKGTPSYGFLEKNDEIIEIEGVSISEWSDIATGIYGNEDRILTVKVLRDGVEHVFEIEAEYGFNNLGFLSYEGSGEIVKVTTETKSAIGGTRKYPSHGAGLRTGDVVTGIDYLGAFYPIESWNDLYSFANETLSEGGKVKVHYDREGVSGVTEEYDCYSDAELGSQNAQAVAKIIGVSASSKFHLGKCFVQGLELFSNAAMLIFNTLKVLFTSSRIGISDMGGFIAIFDMTATAASNGVLSVLQWVGLLSVNLGIINLLPIPALDGGRLVFLGYEAITKKKVNPKVENIMNYIVFLLLMGLMVFILFNDVVRLIGQFI